MNREEALRASDSFDVEERLRSIDSVGQFDDDLSKRAMMRLLTDRNIAVCQAASIYLINRNELDSAVLLFMGLALTTEQQRFGTLLEIKKSRTGKTFGFDRISKDILSGDNFLARVGVNDVLEWLRPKADE